MKKQLIFFGFGLLLLTCGINPLQAQFPSAINLDTIGDNGLMISRLVKAVPVTPVPPTFPILQPGTGWTGPTEQPETIGDSTMSGYDAKAIARWDVVPYQEFDDQFNVGVVAFHMNDIDRVSFSVDDGPWIDIHETQLNPRTDVEEYMATLDASLFAQDGSIEVRAIVWPKGAGEPRVLAGEMASDDAKKGEHSMFLNTNAHSTLSALIRYVSPNGSDTTGDGSINNPYATAMKAARSIQDEQGSNADGGTIYLLPGDHVYGAYTHTLSTRTTDRWLTITRAPNTNQEDVRLTTQTGGDGLRTKLVKVKGIMIAPSDYTRLFSTNGPLEDYLWIDDCVMIGRGNYVDEPWIRGWKATFGTSLSISRCRSGLLGSRLLRDIDIPTLGSDAFTGANLVIRGAVHDVNEGSADFHPDIYQFSSKNPIENIILMQIVTRTREGQGFFSKDVNVSDVAFVNCDLSNHEGESPTAARVFQISSPTDHLLVKGCRFKGTCSWRFDHGFTAHNILISGTDFVSNHPGIYPGIIDLGD